MPWPFFLTKKTFIYQTNLNYFFIAEVETRKFREMVEAIGPDTLKAIASGPQDHQVKMLQSLGLTSTLITDGRTPVNLLSTANGLLGTVTNPTDLAASGNKTSNS